MRSSMFVGVLVVVGLGACGEKTCPPCPTPGTGTGTGTAYQTPIDAPDGDDYGAYEFRLVNQDGKVGFVGTSKTGRVVVVPLDPRTRMFADGKTGTAGEVMTFAAKDNGGCPCIIPRCLPYCRVAATVLDMQPAEFWGSADVPKWTDPVPAPAPTP